jgi:hypothetical protein
MDRPPLYPAPVENLWIACNDKVLSLNINHYFALLVQGYLLERVLP